MKIWFQNHRYKTKKAQKDREKLDQKPSTHPTHHQQQNNNCSSAVNSPPKRVAVPVLVKDGKPCPSGTSSTSNTTAAAAVAGSHDRSISSSPESMSSDGADYRGPPSAPPAAAKPINSFVHRNAAAVCPAAIPFPVSSSTSGLVKGEVGVHGSGLGRFVGGPGSMMSSCGAAGGGEASTFASMMQPPSRHAPLSLHAVESMSYADFAPAAARSCLFNGRTW